MKSIQRFCLVGIELRDAFGIIQGVDQVLREKELEIAVYWLLLFEYSVPVRYNLSGI